VSAGTESSLAAGAPAALVAPRASRGACRICSFPDELIQKINAAIWDGGQVRTHSYRANGANAAKANGVEEIDLKSVTTHADHTEKSWRIASEKHPAQADEKPVYATDFDSIVNRAAALGAQAMDKLDKRMRLGWVEDKDLVSVARMGVAAVEGQRKATDREKRPQLTIQTLFGIVSGHVDTPVGEVKNVTPLIELRGELEEERRQLRAHAGYDDDELASVLNG
jgi:hypothetical protein